MKTAVFPGSFDPFTTGHKNIVDRARGLFDKVIIAIGYNEHKHGFMSVEQRLDSIRSVYDGAEDVEAVSYTGLTVDLCRQKGAGFIIRGVRNTTDFDYERTLADVNRKISGIETVVFIADPEYSIVSSSMVRELMHNDYDVARFLPFDLEKCLHK